MSYLKLILNFIKYLIIENPIKLIMIVASVIAFSYAGTIKGDYEYYNIVSQVKDGNTYVYVTNSKSESNNGYEVFTSDKPEVVKNRQLQVWNYNDFNILLYIVGGILTIIILIGTIIGLINDDDDIGWNIEDCYQRSISTLIYCELEGDTYYYMIMGRLIDKRKDQIRYTSNVAREMRIFNMSDVYRLPKFSTKTQKRNNKLDKLGIN
jgi:hypothetical protein